jgi:hypothetical protein
VGSVEVTIEPRLPTATQSELVGQATPNSPSPGLLPTETCRELQVSAANAGATSKAKRPAATKTPIAVDRRSRIGGIRESVAIAG